MINPVAFICKPLKFGNLCKVYPPTIEEVLTLPYFGQYKKMLTISQDELALELKKQIKEDQKVPTPLEFILANAYHNIEFYKILQDAFKYFTHENIQISIEQKAIIFKDDQQASSIRKISEEDYFDFQNLVREACGDPRLSKPEPEDPNEDPRIRRIKQRARERDAIKSKKGVSGQGIPFGTCLVAICYMGVGITPLNIGEMSYAAMGPLMKMYQEKEKYDLDVRSLLAGADSKKIKPKYWIRNTD